MSFSGLLLTLAYTPRALENGGPGGRQDLSSRLTWRSYSEWYSTGVPSRNIPSATTLLVHLTIAASPWKTQYTPYHLSDSSTNRHLRPQPGLKTSLNQTLRCTAFSKPQQIFPAVSSIVPYLIFTIQIGQVFTENGFSLLCPNAS